ncbi:MAG TPA: dihydroneopterin 2',3'-cyclic phosphate phosphodiesterase, partial [Candidatus Bathyarchaeota archaeon]|nr:dihydroneopterin 2',3'-cyclic phosphate phosphodiesterase [Candidatus Bathyarchaeota archaeon]
MDERLRKLAEKIRDKSLRKKVMELLENPTIEIGGQKFSGLPLE